MKKVHFVPLFGVDSVIFAIFMPVFINKMYHG